MRINLITGVDLILSLNEGKLNLVKVVKKPFLIEKMDKIDGEEITDFLTEIDNNNIEYFLVEIEENSQFEEFLKKRGDDFEKSVLNS